MIPILGRDNADNRRRNLDFQVGNMVFLKVSPLKGLIRFGKKGKLSHRFIGPFEVLERIGEVAYQIALPSRLAKVHNVFHVSMLRKYVPSADHVIDFEPLEIRENLSYEEQPVEILETQQITLRNRVISFVKILWQNHKPEEATWEREDEMREKHPEIFP
ncbi:uncharacterized protein [Typha latifolia]|uniref:uncharacterized protein n=1 Tax=Typha latifolia TaxID=4733 RepID=UPI003C2BA0A2